MANNTLVINFQAVWEKEEIVDRCKVCGIQCVDDINRMFVEIKKEDGELIRKEQTDVCVCDECFKAIKQD